MKLVSIIIPYNKDRGHLQEALASAYDQSYENIEIIEAYSSASLGKNFNDGLKKAKGEYIKILAEDDLLTVHSIKYLVDAIKEDFVTANALNFNDNYHHFQGRKTNLKQMLLRNCIHGGTPLYRRSSFARFGAMDESLTTAEEYDMHLNWIKQGAKHTYTNKIVYLYRIWKGSKSQSKTRDLKRIAYISEIKKRYR